ncbi:MAG: HgcAB-associated protein HgcC [Nitrososphaeria archaeon]
MEKNIGEDMSSEMGCCGVDAIVTVDSKGQLVLPKDLREKIKLKPNDKLAIISCGGNGACCLIMVKAENLGSSIKSFLKPILKGVLG